MKNVKLNLKFKSPSSIEKFYSKIGIQDILQECPNLADILEQISLVPEVQEIKFKTDDPRHLIYQVLRCFKSNVNSGVLIILCRSSYISNASKPSSASRPASPTLTSSSTSSSTSADLCPYLYDADSISL
jgi:hypothetical protein